MQAHATEDIAQVPVFLAAEGRVLLCTPKAAKFHSTTFQNRHFKQLVELLRIVHQNGLVHWDVRFVNIFVMSNGNALLNDWGSAVELGWRLCIFELPIHSSLGVQTAVQGCPPHWRHPELNTAWAVPRPKHDLYSLVKSYRGLFPPSGVATALSAAFAQAFAAVEMEDYDKVVEALQ